MKFILSTILIFFVHQAIAQRPYPHLVSMEIENTYCGDEPYFRIYYEETLAEVINVQRDALPKDHILSLTDEFEASDLVALKLKFNSSELRSEYFLIFTYGPSCDPGFYLIDAATNQTIGWANGMEAFIPGGNSIYTTGHMNTTHNTRRKYSFNGSKFEEVKPEFYYVGLKTKTLKPITLFASQQMTSKLASLPADYNIEVLAARRIINSDNRTMYLIKTELGLLGWATIETAAFRSVQVEGIMFLGD